MNTMKTKKLGRDDVGKRVLMQTFKNVFLKMINSFL
jgi:hypothetical protein